MQYGARAKTNSSVMFVNSCHDEIAGNARPDKIASPRAIGENAGSFMVLERDQGGQNCGSYNGAATSYVCL